MEEVTENDDENDFLPSSVSQKRLRLLAAQLHDLKMDWNYLDSNLLRSSVETGQFTALLSEIDNSLSPFGKKSSPVCDLEENGPETQFDADFVDKIRAMFDVIQRKEELNGSPESIIIDHSKITVLLDYFRTRRSKERESHEKETETKVNEYNQSLHNMTREFSQIAHESMEQANEACKWSQMQMLKDDLDTDRRLQEIQNLLMSSQNEINAALAATEQG